MKATVKRSNSFTILAATISAAVLVVANISSLNVAIPELSRELGASQSDIQWMVDVYAFSLAVLLLPAGALGDRFGRKRMLLFGVFVLMVANGATIFTKDLEFLGASEAKLVIALRALSGIGAAFIFPATLSTITTTLPENKRAKGVAIWTAAVFSGGFLGILLSGALLENYWWGSVFMVMAFLSLGIFALCGIFLPESSAPEESNLDPVGAILSLLAIGGIVFGVMEGPTKGWASTLILLAFIVGGIFLMIFIKWELRTETPLLDLRIFSNEGVRSSSFALLIQFSLAFGFFFVTVPYLAFVIGYGPLNTGLSFLLAAIGLFPASLAAIPLSRKLGFRIVGTFGFLLLGAAFYIGTTAGITNDLQLLTIVLILYGAGMGLVSPPATEILVSALPSEKQGVASALNDVLREFGAVIGIAIAGSVFNSSYRNSISEIGNFPEEIVAAVKETPAVAPMLASSLDEKSFEFLEKVKQAVVNGWSEALWASLIIALIGALGFALWAPSRESSQENLKYEKKIKSFLQYDTVTNSIIIEGSKSKQKLPVSKRVLKSG